MADIKSIFNDTFYYLIDPSNNCDNIGLHIIIKTENPLGQSFGLSLKKERMKTPSLTIKFLQLFDDIGFESV